MGETLQGHYADGTKFYCEHTSHHPPISNFLIEGVNDLYKMYGYYEVTGKMGTNNLVSGMRGPNNLIFKDGHHIRFGFPSFKLGGTVMGERTVEAIGSVFFEDLTNNRKAVLLCNTFKKTGWIRNTSTGCKDHIQGIIYNVKGELTGDKESIRKNYSKDIEFCSDLKHLKDIKEVLCEIDGSWLTHVDISGKRYWDVNVDVPTR